jgi:hypothetical protein
VQEHLVTEERARPVETRFELAAARMVDGWLAKGRVTLSESDLRLVREFLEHSGCRVEMIDGQRVRIVSDSGRAREMSREAAMVAALRRLAARG